MVENKLTVLLHNGEDLDDNLGGRSDEDLSLSSSLGVDDVVLRILSATGLLILPSSDIVSDSDHFSYRWYRAQLQISSVPSLSLLHPAFIILILTRASLRTETRTILTRFLRFSVRKKEDCQEIAFANSMRVCSLKQP